ERGNLDGERPKRGSLVLRSEPDVVPASDRCTDRAFVRARPLDLVERELDLLGRLVLAALDLVIEGDRSLLRRLHVDVEDARVDADGLAELIHGLVGRHLEARRLSEKAPRGDETRDLSPEPIEVEVVDAGAPTPRVVDRAEERASAAVAHVREDHSTDAVDRILIARMAREDDRARLLASDLRVPEK